MSYTCRSFRGVTGSNQPEKEMDTLSHKTMQPIMCYFWTTMGDDTLVAALWRIPDELASLSILLGAKANAVINFIRGKVAWHERVVGELCSQPALSCMVSTTAHRYLEVILTRWWTPAPCPQPQMSDLWPLSDYAMITCEGMRLQGNRSRWKA